MLKYPALRDITGPGFCCSVRVKHVTSWYGSLAPLFAAAVLHVTQTSRPTAATAEVLKNTIDDVRSWVDEYYGLHQTPGVEIMVRGVFTPAIHRAVADSLAGWRRALSFTFEPVRNDGQPILSYLHALAPSPYFDELTLSFSRPIKSNVVDALRAIRVELATRPPHCRRLSRLDLYALCPCRYSDYAAVHAAVDEYIALISEAETVEGSFFMIEKSWTAATAAAADTAAAVAITAADECWLDAQRLRAKAILASNLLARNSEIKG